MPKTTGVMIDLETLGLKDTAKIIQIGMVAFGDDFVPSDQFIINVDPEQQPERTITKSTLEFWAEQPKKVQKSVLKDPSSPDFAAGAMIEWLEKQPGVIELWANHLLFDINLGNSFLDMFSDRRLTDDLIKFYNLLDYATLRHVVQKRVGGRQAFNNLAMETYLKELGDDDHLAHNALDDCLFQLHALKMIMEAIG